MRERGITRAEVHGRNTEGGEPCDVRPAELRPWRRTDCVDERLRSRKTEARHRSRCLVDKLHVVPGEHVQNMLLGVLDRSIGREPEVDGDGARIRNDIACDAAADTDSIEALAVLQAVDHRPAGLIGGQRRENQSGRVNGVVAHP